MKFIFTVACALMFAFLDTPVSMAATLGESRDEAEQYYQHQDYKRAFKAYLALAKWGDHYSQEKVAKMYEAGEGKSKDLIKAYSWSVLAAQGGKKEVKSYSDALLQLNENKKKAQKSAEKLMKKYGKEALAKKAEASANRDPSRCIGSLLACPRR